ncbi:septum formation protein Maf [Permianibacter sp. IMCC34836]|uniref:Maf family protein n=1 Tax=Permianibacter fluminis TaxID=2738515 RepID=UPI001555BBD7|nr:Maf family protein [Permianibacter fluminis]NQD38899.1 septum formation protein Maf [Permianibacter fluminis]
MTPIPLILASGSPYRARQLSQLGLTFEIVRPDVDETPLAGEPPADLALRLAEDKARAVARNWPKAWVIGSDQTADCGGLLLGKPGSAERAQAQLEQMSCKTVLFHSALCLLAPDGQAERVNVTTTVQLRQLSPAEIAAYIKKEQPLDCAGSFKVEGLGISLFDWIRSDDPSALIGLPLIGLCRLLREAGCNPTTIP